MAKRWTSSEQATLKSKFSILAPVDLLAFLPGRTVMAIRHKAERLGLLCPKLGYSKALKLKWKSPEYKESTSQNIRQVIQSLYNTDPTFRQRVSQRTKEAMRRPEVRERVLARRPKDLEWIRKMLSSRRPTDIEQRLIEVIQKYSLPYKYTGDGTFLIGQFNPDFVNTNGQKIAIDIFGDHWHVPSEIPQRRAAFAEWGWELVILWGHEVKSLTELEILARIPR